ncbi:hypothetical protein ACFQZ4_45040 [Catellatospora coxensis]
MLRRPGRPAAGRRGGGTDDRRTGDTRSGFLRGAATTRGGPQGSHDQQAGQRQQVQRHRRQQDADQQHDRAPPGQPPDAGRQDRQHQQPDEEQLRPHLVHDQVDAGDVAEVAGQRLHAGLVVGAQREPDVRAELDHRGRETEQGHGHGAGAPRATGQQRAQAQDRGYEQDDSGQREQVRGLPVQARPVHAVGLADDADDPVGGEQERRGEQRDSGRFLHRSIVGRRGVPRLRAGPGRRPRCPARASTQARAARRGGPRADTGPYANVTGLVTCRSRRVSARSLRSVRQ